ncbi:MAG: hypothetical protein H6Q22_248 [Bacteroidetes bacterium]|nr:hypothetical protein [Bacteroidota bacterium]
MKIDRFFQLFVVKEKKFYPLYIAQLEIIKVAAEDLKSLFLESNPELQKEYYKKIKELETKGDKVTAQIYDELNKTFVTPFDREDIHILASRIIVKKCNKIKEIEHKVDDLYEEFNSFLFDTEKDAIELVKHKNIVQSLEDTTDRAKDISDTVRSIIIKLA